MRRWVIVGAGVALTVALGVVAAVASALIDALEQYDEEST